MNTLKKCENVFGKISPQIEKRIKTFINNPTFDNWDDIAGVIITGNKMETIWQAVCKVDSDFPKKGRATDFEGNIIKEWERIPTPLQVLQVIKKATQE